MDKLISTLELLSGGSQVMSTDQLAKCLSMNAKVISRMRNEKRFPINHKLIGTKIVYPILNVAKYLSEDDSGQQTQSNIDVKKDVSPEKRRQQNKAKLPDLSRKMMMLGLVNALDSFIETMEVAKQFIVKTIEKEKMNSELSIKHNFVEIKNKGKV